MRDIVYKKVEGETHIAETPEPARAKTTPAPELPPFQEPSWFETALSAAGSVAAIAKTKLEGTQPVPQELPKAPRKRLPKQAKARKPKRTAASIAQSAKRGLSTTHGKLLVAHSFALIALGIYGFTGGMSGQQAPAGAEAEEVASVRRYLPAVQDSTASKPFLESVSSLPNPSLNIYRWTTPWSVQNGDAAANRSTYAGQSAFWLTVTGDGRTVQPKADWSVWDTFASSGSDAGDSYLTVTGDPEITSNILSDSSIREEHIRTLLDTVKTHGFDGIDIDFEGLGSTNKDGFTSYVNTLTAAFHAENKRVAITLEARIANAVPMDWKAVGAIADEVRIMAYDYHARTTPAPGPVAPLSWTQEVAAYAASQIPASKIVMGLGNYGYDWMEPADEGGNWTGVGISQERAVALAEEKGSAVIRMTGIDERGYDIGAIPAFVYTDENGKAHSVWFEDATSLQDKLKVVSQYGIKGVIFWSVGLGDADFWSAQGN